MFQGISNATSLSMGIDTEEVAVALATVGKLISYAVVLKCGGR